MSYNYTYPDLPRITGNAAFLILIFVSFLVFFGKRWIQTKIKESVAKGYKESIEKYKDQLSWQSKRKEQSVEVAEFFSLHHKWKYFPEMNKDEIKYDLQRKYWNLAIWVDAPILRALNEHFDISTSDENAHKEVMVKVRKLLHQNDDITANEITHFLSEMEQSNVENIKKS